MKIALVCSAGGHLTEMKQLEGVYSRFKHFFVTFEREDSRDLENAYFITDPKRSPGKAVKNFFQSLRIFWKERPDVVISTGAGVAVPFCLISKIGGKKVVYIESFCRVEQPSFTGRIIYWIADLFLVQWEDLVGKYGSKARFWGRLL